MSRPWAARSLHRRICCLAAACLTLTLVPARASYPTSSQEDLAFFTAEAEAFADYTAAYTPYTYRNVPATTRVIDAEDLRAFGGLHLWDALRGAPGVDVIAARAAHGLVGIRGLSKVGNNRVLLLLDGRRIADGDSESSAWETLPLPVSDIERIEIVEGPASAVFGGNAVTGVVNIITVPASAPASASLILGDAGTRTGTLAAGGQVAGHRLRLAVESRRLDRFQGGEVASEVLRLRLAVQGSLSTVTPYRLQAGFADQRTDVSLSYLGHSVEAGRRGFVTADVEHGPLRSGARLQIGSTTLESFRSAGASRFGSADIYAQARLRWRPGVLVLGAEGRREGRDSRLADADHDLFAFYAEQRWPLGEHADLWTSARLDRHPHAGTEVSPRLALVVRPRPSQSVRLSLGSAFRYPSLLENHLAIEDVFPVAGLNARGDAGGGGVLDGLSNGRMDTVEYTVRGNPRLAAERLRFVELAHQAHLAGWRTQASLFYYWLADIYALGTPVITSPRLGVLRTGFSFVNSGLTHARGGELDIRTPPSRRLRLRASYSYQRLSGDRDSQASRGGTPRHKSSAWTSYRRGRLDLDLAVHRVGATRWNANRLTLATPPELTVPAYTLVQVSARYRLRGVLRGWHVQALVFNLLDDRHEELAGSPDPAVRGQAGEVIGARRALRLVYGW